MIPATFDYQAPASLEEAVALLAEHGDDAKILTGGHSLIPLLKLRLAQPEIVIDLRRLEALRKIAADGSGVVIGASATHAEIAASTDVKKRCPVVAETAGRIGDVQVRNVGTIGGSIVHADPASDWPAALLAAEAEVTLAGPEGTRTVAATEFFVGALESAARADEIVTSVRVPDLPAGHGSAYVKVAQSASGFALCGVAAVCGSDPSAGARVAVTGIADIPYRATEVEAALAAGSSLEDAAADAAVGKDVLEDIHASTRYRTHLARVITRRALAEAVARAGAGS